MKRLTIDDYEKLKPYLELSTFEGYNYDFTTLMMWNEVYKTEYEIHENFMIILHTFRNMRFFIMPFCKKQYINDAIVYMVDYARSHDFEFQVDSVSPQCRKYIQEVFNDTFLYVKTPSYYDYVYERSNLVSLSGKKMQKRRNHYNGFIKDNHNYAYKNYDDEDFDNVMAFYDIWSLDHPEILDDAKEKSGIITLLKNRDILGVKAGCIYIDDILVAFTIASLLKNDMIHIHVEKAKKDVRGLYVAINKLFLESNFQDTTYVNREEDMGNPSLRKAKQAMHPIKQIEKQWITKKKVDISIADDKDFEDIKELWKANFLDESESSTEYYFTEKYYEKGNKVYVAKVDSTLVATLQIRPFTMQDGEVVYFIFGVATNENYQRNGIFKNLMNFVLNEKQYIGKRIFLQAYHPEIYQQFGFKKQYFHNIIDVDVKSFIGKYSVTNDYRIDDLVSLYNEYTKHFKGSRTRDIDYYKLLTEKQLEAFNQSIATVYKDNELRCYGVYSVNDDKINFSEVIYKSKDDVINLLSAFKEYNEHTITVDTKLKLDGNISKHCTMMTNDTDTLEEDKMYINEVY